MMLLRQKTSKTNILHLPDEILCMIFNYLPAIIIEQLKLICKRFNQTIIKKNINTRINEVYKINFSDNYYLHYIRELFYDRNHIYANKNNKIIKINILTNKKIIRNYDNRIIKIYNKNKNIIIIINAKSEILEIDKKNLKIVSKNKLLCDGVGFYFIIEIFKSHIYILDRSITKYDLEGNLIKKISSDYNISSFKFGYNDNIISIQLNSLVVLKQDTNEIIYKRNFDKHIGKLTIDRNNFNYCIVYDKKIMVFDKNNLYIHDIIIDNYDPFIKIFAFNDCFNYINNERVIFNDKGEYKNINKFYEKDIYVRRIFVCNDYLFLINYTKNIYII